MRLDPVSFQGGTSGPKTESIFRRYAIVDETAIAEGLQKVHRMRQREAQERQERTVLPLRREA
jgi:hypothetical protein